MNEMQYETILTALTDKITAQQTTIYLKDYEISELKRKLAEAEGMEARKMKKANLPKLGDVEVRDERGCKQ